MLANLAIKIGNANIQSSFYVSGYLLKTNLRTSGNLFFLWGGHFWCFEPFKIHFNFFLFLFYNFLAIFFQFKNKATNHCNNGLLLPTSSAFLCWRLKDNTTGVVLPHFKKKKRISAFLMINCFLGNFGWTSFSSVISTNFAIQGENITKLFDITNMKIIHKSVFSSPLSPKPK